MMDWKALGNELSALHGGMSKAAAIIEVPYQNFQRICQGKTGEPKFAIGLKILAALGAVSLDEKVLTLRKPEGTIVPTQPETPHEPNDHPARDDD